MTQTPRKRAPMPPTSEVPDEAQTIQSLIKERNYWRDQAIGEYAKRQARVEIVRTVSRTALIIIAMIIFMILAVTGHLEPS